MNRANHSGIQEDYLWGLSHIELAHSKLCVCVCFLIMAAISFAALHSFQAAGMGDNNLVYPKLERVYLALFPPQPNLNALLGASPHNRVLLAPLKEPPSPG